MGPIVCYSNAFKSTSTKRGKRDAIVGLRFEFILVN